jgi:hypothetical protein
MGRKRKTITKCPLYVFCNGEVLLEPLNNDKNNMIQKDKIYIRKEMLHLLQQSFPKMVKLQLEV